MFGTEGGHNLAGPAKAAALVEAFGEQGFDYIGNAPVDLPIWRTARTALIAGGDKALARRLLAVKADAVVLAHEGGGFRPYWKAMRPHQWLKNLLLFVPAAAGHTLVADLPTLLLAFAAFCMCASSVYIANDLLDLASDRDHPRKRRRPFAAGTASATTGIMMAVGLLVVAFALTVVLPPMFGVALAAYYVLTTAYSFSLKRKPVIDVVALACLYGMRLLAGGYASGTELSPWLEALAIFLFLSLALVKRCAELVVRIQANKGDPVGRGYRLTDLPVLEAMAAAAGYNSGLVLALYINSSPERAMYAHPHRLWVLCILLLVWISRILLLTRRGEMNDDPVVFAVSDRWSQILGAACAVVVIAASY